MGLNIDLVLLALAVVFLIAAVGISLAYNRLQTNYTKSAQDRDSFHGILEASNDALFVINFVSGKIHLANAKATFMRIFRYSPPPLK